MMVRIAGESVSRSGFQQRSDQLAPSSGNDARHFGPRGDKVIRSAAVQATVSNLERHPNYPLHLTGRVIAGAESAAAFAPRR